MLLKNKWVSDRVMLKLVAKILRKSPMAKGYKITTERGVEKVTSEEIIQFVEDLAEALYKGDYGEIKHCKTCGNFDPKFCGRGRGWCPEYGGYHSARDFCSGWIPMTEQQVRFRKKSREELENLEQFEQLQTQRAGNGSKGSTKGNRPTAGAKAKRRSDS